MGLCMKKNNNTESGIVVLAYDPGTQDTEAERLL